MQVNNFSKQILVRIQRKTNPLHRWWKNKLRHTMEYGASDGDQLRCLSTHKWIKKLSGHPVVGVER